MPNGHREIWEIMENNEQYLCYAETINAGAQKVYDIAGVMGTDRGNTLIFKNGTQAIQIRINSVANHAIPLAASEVLTFNKGEMTINTLYVYNTDSGASNATVKIIILGSIKNG